MTRFDFIPPASDAAVDWAHAYALAGMAVFPINARKVPVISREKGGRGVYDATTDPRQIDEWWREYRHAEIAWAVPASVVVIDLDEKDGKHGVRDFFKRECIRALDVETPIATTPSGGLQLFCDACWRVYENKTTIAGTGIDLRTAGGYVGLPVAGNGREWLKPLSTRLAPAPSWLPVKQAARPPAEARPFNGEAHPEAKRALKDACQAIETAPCGSQEATLNGQCFHIGRRAGGGQIDAEAAIEELCASAAKMVAHRGPWRGLDAKVRRAVEDGAKSPWEDRATFHSVLDIAGQVARATPLSRDAVTRWGAILMGEHARAGRIHADLARRVLFEAAMRNGLPGNEATSIISAASWG